MPRGPEHQRLATYVDNADPGALDDAATQWRFGMELLRKVSAELQLKANGMKTAQSYSDGEIWSGETAATARDAFGKSSKAMQDKSDEMEKGATAFNDAATGIRHARHRLTELDARDPGALPTQPPIAPGPRSHAEELAQSNYDTGVSNWWKDYNANETDATTAITHLQNNHTKQAAVFQSIHGETPPEKPVGPGGGDDPVNTGTRPGVSHHPGQHVGHLVHENNLTPPDPNLPDEHNNLPDGGNTDPGGSNTGPGGGIDPGTGTGTGLPAGPTTTSPLGPISSGTTGGSLGAVGGVGAVGGGALGGVAAAGLAGGLAGSLNGGLAPVGAGGGVRGGLSASGVRGIGATSRGTGVGSVLGRGTATGARAGAGGMASRAGGRGGGRGAAGRGSRGAAGTRGAGAGAAAGAGRGGSKDKKRRGEDRDLFDDGQDWIDDEAQPGLID